MFEAAQGLRAELTDLEARLADPQILTDESASRRIGRRYSQVAPIVAGLDERDALLDDLAAARELSREDVEFGAEADRLAAAVAVIEAKLTQLLAPRDPHDDADALVEIKAGEGGEESALFASDLFTMYSRYAAQVGWKITVLDSQSTDLGGCKSMTFSVASSALTPPARLPYGVLRFEGGVHRVQRVPVTESQGRIHTSAAGVLVMPDIEADEVEIAPDDLRIDVFRASGPGGQGVNTTDSAVRITHLPTGVVVSCQNERSQLQNREQAMRMLRARLVAQAALEAEAAASQARRSQVRTVDRSERIRTYNFPENRITDHRVGYKAHNLDAVLAGDLEAVVEALQRADLAERLAHG